MVFESSVAARSTSFSLPVQLMPSHDPVSLVILSNEGHWNNCISIFTALPSFSLSSPHLFSLSSPPINQKCIKSKVGPIKGRIPPRRTDKAYLINKCFSIREDLCLPPHPCLWYLIIPTLTHTHTHTHIPISSLSAIAHATLMYLHTDGMWTWGWHCSKGRLQNKTFLHLLEKTWHLL